MSSTYRPRVPPMRSELARTGPASLRAAWCLRMAFLASADSGTTSAERGACERGSPAGHGQPVERAPTKLGYFVRMPRPPRVSGFPSPGGAGGGGGGGDAGRSAILRGH
jgi:hypothetical protein